MQRLLIVNADDFGLTNGVNQGILRARREGILTSASLMVRCSAAKQAVQCADGLDLGLHIDLGEWEFRDGQWSANYERVPLDNAAVVEEEVRNQLDLFRQLTGCEPSHLDSHQHVHQHEPVRSIVRALAAELSIPLRGQPSKHPQDDVPVVHYLGSFYGQGANGQSCPEHITSENLIKLLRDLPPGITELGCHPGEDEDLDSVYRLERLQEMQSLCNPQVRQTISEEHIQLTTFRDLVRGAAAS